MQWKLLPSAIVDTLKRNGALKFEELYKNTKKRFAVSARTIWKAC